MAEPTGRRSGIFGHVATPRSTAGLASRRLARVGQVSPVEQGHDDCFLYSLRRLELLRQRPAFFSSVAVRQRLCLGVSATAASSSAAGVPLAQAANSAIGSGRCGTSGPSALKNCTATGSPRGAAPPAAESCEPARRPTLRRPPTPRAAPALRQRSRLPLQLFDLARVLSSAWRRSPSGIATAGPARAPRYRAAPSANHGRC